uniref:Uncharacterized protein n=1 Tax=Aegilops tauschii subsp. strangulata TaxID=200361 RepID=A0A453F5W9_AEGTS
LLCWREVDENARKYSENGYFTPIVGAAKPQVRRVLAPPGIRKCKPPLC